MAGNHNPELVRILSSSFVRRKDHTIIKTGTADIANPPTDAELDSLFGDRTNYADGTILLAVDSSGINEPFWLVVKYGGTWNYVNLTRAV